MRLQLALNVPSLDEAVDFYSKLFDTPAYKTKPGYANFEVENPPLKLVLFENPTAEPGSINHLGVETETATEVEDAERRLTASGLTTTGIDDTICCYAEKVETWVHGPDGNRWEYYVKTADHESGFDNVVVASRDANGGEASVDNCCVADPSLETAGAAAAGTGPSCC